MDRDALHLKPHITLNQDNNIEPDTPKEDRALRPYLSILESVSHLSDQSQMPEMDVSVDQFDCIESQAENRNRRDRNWREETADDNVENYDYLLLQFMMTQGLVYNIMLIDNEVFYQRTDGKIDFESTDNESDQKKTYGSAVGIEPEQADPQDDRSGDKCKGEKYKNSFPEKQSHKQKLACHRQHPPQDDILGLTKSFFSGNIKVSGKRQKQKKLSDLFGIFDTFHNLEPAPVNIIVLPVNRQNVGMGQDPHGQEPPPQLPPLPSHGQRSWPPDDIYGLPFATFSQELYRLGTFLNMPPGFPVSLLRLAEAGFLNLPDGAIVCYFCGVQYDQQNTGNTSVETHRQLNPNCPILTGVNCNNVPVRTMNLEETNALMELWSISGPPLPSVGGPSGQATTAEPRTSAPLASVITSPENSNRPDVDRLHVVDISDCEGEHHVLTSFETQVNNPASGQMSAGSVTVSRQSAGTSNNQNAGPNDIQASSSAQQQQQQQLSAGSVGEASDASRSAGCGNAVHAAISDGTAQLEVPGNNTHSRPARETHSDHQVVTYQQLAIIVDAPRCPEMALVNERVRSFGNWPSSHAKTPMALAEAGFYYGGYADCARCFYCGGGLKNWEPSDDPWVEHARWFSKCSYVRQYQGQDFVDIIIEINVDRERRPISMEEVQEEIRRRRAGGDHLEEPAVDPAISSALQVGFIQADIDTAAHRLQSEGHLMTVERLLNYLEEDGAIATGDADSLEGANADLGQVGDLVTENSEMRQRRTCKICLDKEVCIVFLPCGHLVCCAECSPALKNCPMCRSQIKGRIRAFAA